MKYLKGYKLFLEAFQAKDKYEAITKIVSYIKSVTGYKLYPYFETFKIKKETKQLEGQLYIALDDNIAIRFNWDNTDTRSEIDSIDFWKNFEFDTKPDYTLELNGNSVTPALKQIAEFINSPEKMVVADAKEEVLAEDVESDQPSGNNMLQTQLDDYKKKLKRVRSPEKKASYETIIANLEAKLAEDETTTTNSMVEVKSMINNDIKLNVFKTIEKMTLQVAKGKSNALLVTGGSGMGKSGTVLETLSSIGLASGNGYIKITGDISSAGLYQTLFIHRHKLLLFDDCDSVFNEQSSLDMLKAVLDTYPKREVSYMKKGYYDPTGVNDLEMQMKWDETQKLPNQFIFDGKIIFLTNKTEEQIENNTHMRAILGRSLAVDVNLNKQEVLERMRELILKILPEESINDKYEALNYLDELSQKHILKFGIDLRSLVHAINIRCNPENEVEESIGGHKIALWKLLVKQTMVKI